MIAQFTRSEDTPADINIHMVFLQTPARTFLKKPRIAQQSDPYYSLSMDPFNEIHSISNILVVKQSGIINLLIIKNGCIVPTRHPLGIIENHQTAHFTEMQWGVLHFTASTKHTIWAPTRGFGPKPATPLHQQTCIPWPKKKTAAASPPS